MADLISVGITCYNSLATIERSIESAINQDWRNVEIIVVDDGSTDGSWEIIEHYANSNPKVRVFKHEKNLGYPAALNLIIKEAKGSYIAFFDSDDSSEHDRLSSQYERLVSYYQNFGSTLVFCYTNRAVVRQGCSSFDHIAKAIGRYPIEPQGIEVARYIFGDSVSTNVTWGIFGSCTLMASKGTFQQLGDFDIEFRRSAEWDMAIRLAFMGGHFIAVDKPLVTQYKTQGNYKSGKTPLVYSLKLRKKYYQYLKGEKFYFASLALAFSNFYASRKLFWLSYSFRVLAFILSPRLFGRYLHKKVAHRN